MTSVLPLNVVGVLLAFPSWFGLLCGGFSVNFREWTRNDFRLSVAHFPLVYLWNLLPFAVSLEAIVIVVVMSLFSFPCRHIFSYTRIKWEKTKNCGWVGVVIEVYGFCPQLTCRVLVMYILQLTFLFLLLWLFRLYILPLWAELPNQHEFAFFTPPPIIFL